MLALSIRQPYAELILRGIKRIEYRTRPTRIIGERFWIYVPMKLAAGSGQQAEEAAKIWSDDLAVTTPRRGEHPPKWLMELAGEFILDKLPRGVIVGSAVIERVEELEAGSMQRAAGSTVPEPSDLLPAGSRRLPAMYAWHLVDVQRARKFRKPTGHPQPVWFRPFD
jgi:predicted transcriptional regulator